MKLNTKTYRITFTEYHDNIEDSDKRITVQYQTVEERDYPLSLVDMDYEIKRNMIKELEYKLGINE